MCGVFGVVGLGDPELGKRVARVLRHRGPDDSGVWVMRDGTPVTLANTRLSIIDLSDAGHMPMLSSDGRMAITYNGEIYNFHEIRVSLEKLGHRFRSKSDTEVILNAYSEWGEACLHRLRGMFSFLIWDVTRQRLFAARDRLGIKPLYWTETNKGTMLASELKAILASGLIAPELDQNALHHYLTYYCVPPPYTMLEGVHTLLPGHFLTWEKGNVTIQKYWEVPESDTQDLVAATKDPAGVRSELRKLLEEAISLRMVSDVSVGAFLSGGVDSSAVVALMARLSGERLKTFSIGFTSEGDGIDERSYARSVSDRYETEHTEVVVTGSDVLEHLPHFVRAMDQPTGDGLNTYLVSQASAQHVKVALSGLGGDELFAGYRQYRYLQQSERISEVWQQIPDWGKMIAQVAARQVSGLTGKKSIAEVPGWLEGEFLARYLRTRTLFGETAKTALYADCFAEQQSNISPSIDLLRHYALESESDPIERVTRLELKSYLSHMLLRDTDAMSMAHSLEVRVPLIDHKLVEFATRIPASLKLGSSGFGSLRGRSKVILTDALSDLLPEVIVNRRKQGFHMPLGAWLRGALQPMVEHTLSHKSVRRRGIFDPIVVDGIRQEFEAGRGHYMRVWALFVLELWQQEFLD